MVTPKDRKMAISFDCSNRFALIDVLSEKKQRNIDITIITVNIEEMTVSTYSTFFVFSVL